MTIVINQLGDRDSTAIEIIRGALEVCGVQGAAEPISAEDSNLCLRVLNRILKLLPAYGFSWPKVTSTNVSIAWSGSSPSLVSLPLDYFGVPVLDYTNAAGASISLREFTKAQFDALQTPDTTAPYPTDFFIFPNSTVRLYPVPTQDPQIKLGYQSIVADVRLTDSPNVSIIIQDLLEYWLADEISLKFEVPDSKRLEISKRLMGKREHALQWAVSTAPIAFEVVG
jgi:hypothetical protein